MNTKSLFVDPEFAEGCEAMLIHLYGSFEIYEHQAWGPLLFQEYYAGKTVVDLGCGTGTSTKSILKFNPTCIIGIDGSDTLLTVARRITDKRAEFRKAWAERLTDTVKESVDTVVAIQSFAYFEKPLRVLKQVYHCLNAGGHFLFDTCIQNQPLQTLSAIAQEAFANAAESHGIELQITPPEKPAQPVHSEDSIRKLVAETNFEIASYTEKDNRYSQQQVLACLTPGITSFEEHMYRMTGDKDFSLSLGVCARANIQRNTPEQYLFQRNAFVILKKR